MANDYRIEIITGIIGSGLLATALTALISEMNEPRLSIDVKTPNSHSQSYQVIVRNEGGNSEDRSILI